MSLKILVFCTFCVFGNAIAEQNSVDTISESLTQSGNLPAQDNSNDVDEVIRAFSKKARHIIASEEIIREEELEKLYEEMVILLDDIIKLMKEPANIYKFIELKGIERVILPNIKAYYVDLRTKLLILTMMLFDTAPTTTSVMAPVALLDNILDIFEEDNNLAIKARIIDILSIWLPDNPKMQARVMKQKGLEPFYTQVHKLDASVTHKLLTLFNKILKEHLVARAEGGRTKHEIIYKTIGLLEHLGTKSICQGFLNVYREMWLYSQSNSEYMLPIFELMKNLQPHCEKFYKGKAKALDLFQEFMSQIQEGGAARGPYERLGVNMTDLEVILQRYVKVAGSVKDEL